MIITLLAVDAEMQNWPLLSPTLTDSAEGPNEAAVSSMSMATEVRTPAQPSLATTASNEPTGLEPKFDKS